MSSLSHVTLPSYTRNAREPSSHFSGILNGVKTISQMDAKHGFEGQQDDTSVNVGGTVNCGTPVVAHDKETVRDGNW